MTLIATRVFPAYNPNVPELTIPADLASLHKRWEPNTSHPLTGLIAGIADTGRALATSFWVHVLILVILQMS